MPRERENVIRLCKDGTREVLPTEYRKTTDTGACPTSLSVSDEQL